MKSVISFGLGALMFATSCILRRYHNYTADGFSTAAIMAAWVCFIWPLRLKWGDAGMEQWKAIRRRGPVYFVLVHGMWWYLFLVLFVPSIKFAAGKPIEFEPSWLYILILCAAPFGALSDWRYRERRFARW